MLMLAGIQEILIISTPDDLPLYERLLGDGKKWGMSFSYAEQAEPKGLAEAFIIGKEFIGNDNVCLVLGDNIFFGHNMPEKLRQAASLEEGAVIFAYAVKDPERYGVVHFDENYKALGIEEKPVHPKSNYAVPGIYFYDNNVTKIASELQPSARGELEITDLNLVYLNKGQLMVTLLGRGIAWLDAGTHGALLQASNFIETVEQRQGMLISCPEEIAFKMGFIDAEQLKMLVKELPQKDFGEYLLDLIGD
jgi:glucose-1-phosphate thymidylyltransferase